MSAIELKLKSLERRHYEIMAENNWKDTDESRNIEIEYRELNQVFGAECMECGSHAGVTCQYH